MTTNENLQHHIRQEYCRTRLKYREGKKLTAAKAYCVIDESKHLLVFGVPKINLAAEVRNKFMKFGKITQFECVTNEMAKEMELEQFTDCYHIVYNKLEHARKAKKFLDARNFYGGILHISYGCERETVDELRQKLQQRKSEVAYRLKLAEDYRKLHPNEDKQIDVDETGRPPPKRQKKHTTTS